MKITAVRAGGRDVPITIREKTCWKKTNGRTAGEIPSGGMRTEAWRSGEVRFAAKLYFSRIKAYNERQMHISGGIMR